MKLPAKLFFVIYIIILVIVENECQYDQLSDMSDKEIIAVIDKNIQSLNTALQKVQNVGADNPYYDIIQDFITLNTNIRTRLESLKSSVSTKSRDQLLQEFKQIETDSKSGMKKIMADIEARKKKQSNTGMGSMGRMGSMND